MTTLPDIIGTTDSHRGYRINGLRVPSVTQVLEAKGYVDLSFLPPMKLKEVQERGTKVHTLCEQYETDTLDWATVPDHLQGYLEAYIQFLEDTQFHPDLIEVPVFHPTLYYAGRIDRAGTFQRWGTRAIVDIKTGQLQKTVRLQLAGYLLAHHRVTEDGQLCAQSLRELGYRRFAVQVQANGAYVMSPEYDDPDDFAVFASELRGMHWMLKNGVKELKV